MDKHYLDNMIFNLENRKNLKRVEFTKDAVREVLEYLKELKKQSEQLAELKAKSDLRAGIVSKEVNKICKQVIEENEQLKAENEKLKTCRCCECQNENEFYLKQTISDLEQQLKEKDEENKLFEKLNASLNRRLQSNTKQVCEKIREKFGYKYNTQLVVSSKYLCDFLDQIEKGGGL